MCMGIVDMRWKFGGNFQPLRMVCAEDWKKCLIAVSKYVWSEAVTEVVDYLKDDLFVWKVLAIGLTLIILIHTVYYKLCWVHEKSTNKENLNKVGFKVQDLELKVNILTYKMQYGTWPLPHHIYNSDIKHDLQKTIRLTLTNPEAKKSWIKHLLLSSRKIKDYNFNNKNLVVPSVKSLSRLVNLETKYISSKFQRRVPSIASGDLTDRSSGDNSISECYWLNSKQRQISKKENLEHKYRQSVEKSVDTLLNRDLQNIKDTTISNETFVVKEELQVVKQEKKNLSNQAENQKQNKAKNKKENKVENRKQYKVESEKIYKAERQKQTKVMKNQDSRKIKSCSENTNICPVKCLREENQLKEDSSDQSKESDMNCKTKVGYEGRLEKLENLEMGKQTKTEDSLELRLEDTNSTNTILLDSIKKRVQSLTDDVLKDDSNILPSNLNIAFLAKTITRPSSTSKSNLTSTQETLHQVRKKLETLHNILLTYDSSDCEQNDRCSIKKHCVLQKEAESKNSSVSLNIDAKKIKIIEEVKNCSDFEQFESLAHSSSISSIRSDLNMFNVKKKADVHSLNDEVIDSSDPENKEEKEKKVSESDSKVSTNTFIKISPDLKDSTEESRFNSNSTTKVKSEFALDAYDINLNNNQITTSKTVNNIDCNSAEGSISMDISEDQYSQFSDQVEFYADNLDNELTPPLFQQDLQIKDSLVSQVKLKRELVTNEYSNTESKENNKELEKSLSGKENFTVCQNVEENFKSVFPSISSENFNFGDLSPLKNLSTGLEIGLKEIRNESQAGMQSDKKIIASEIGDELIKTRGQDKKSIYVTEKEKEDESNEEKENEIRQKDDINSKQITYLKERIKFERANETLKETIEEKNECTIKNYKLDFDAEKVEKQNLNSFAPTDSSSDESLTQFIKELTSDRVKVAQVFKEIKFNLNFAKSNEKLFNIEEAQEQESVLSLQRRPGSFSLAENESKENLLNPFDIDQTFNSKTNIPTEIDANFHVNEKDKDSETEKAINTNINEMNKQTDSCENIQVEFDVNSNFDSEFNSQLTEAKNTIAYKSLTELSMKEKDEELINEILETTSDCKELQEPLQEKKSIIALNREPLEILEIQEMVDNSQSNLISDPSSSLYFTPSISDDKFVDNLLTSFSALKENVELKESILQDANNSLENREMMLIDLTGDNPDLIAEIIKSERNSESKIENEKLNILDEIFEEKVIENVCLIPNKIQTTHDTEFNNNNNENHVESCTEIKSKNFLTESENIIEKPTNDFLQSQQKMFETNKSSHCPSASSLQSSLCNAKKNPTLINSNVAKAKHKADTPVKPINRSTLKNRSTEKTINNNKQTSAHKLTENPSKEKQLRARSYLNLNTCKEKSDNQIQRRSRSFVSPRMIQTSPRELNNLRVEGGVKYTGKTIKSTTEIEKNRFTSRTSIKSNESQKSSKSCIPILKSRLDNKKKQEPKVRYRSPTRGPLTINPGPDDLDLKVTGYLSDRSKGPDQNSSNEKSFGDNTGTVFNLLKEESPILDEKTIIYINIMTGQDQSTRKVVNPKKFLEFMKDREMKVDNFTNKEKSNGNSETKIFHFMSVKESDELSKKNLQNKFLFHVEQKEREISVKPSVIDNSTSVSDFPEFCSNEHRDENKFKIFDVPEELTKEEYIDLLDLLNQDSNLEQLRKMHSLCSKLGLGFQE